MNGVARKETMNGSGKCRGLCSETTRIHRDRPKRHTHFVTIRTDGRSVVT